MANPDNYFKPGHNKPGPGRKKLSHVEKVVRASLRHNIAESAHLLELTRAEADEMIKRNKKEGFLTLLQETMLLAVQKRDTKTLEMFINRMLGKPKETVEQTGNVPGTQIIVTIPSNGREVDPPKPTKKKAAKKSVKKTKSNATKSKD